MDKWKDEKVDRQRERTSAHMQIQADKQTER